MVALKIEDHPDGRRVAYQRAVALVRFYHEQVRSPRPGISGQTLRRQFGQIAAGVLLVLGLFTPVAAAGALAYTVTGVLADMMAAHEEARLASFLTDGHEYKVILVAAIAAIILIGPGRYGFDAGRGWARRPLIGSFVALLVGLGAGVAVWVLLNGGNPLA